VAGNYQVSANSVLFCTEPVRLPVWSWTWYIHTYTQAPCLRSKNYGTSLEENLINKIQYNKKNNVGALKKNICKKVIIYGNTVEGNKAGIKNK